MSHVILARQTCADAAPAAALEAPPARAMTLAEALTFAREHQPQVLAARARIEEVQANARIPGAQWLPKVGAMAELVGSTTNNTTTTVINTSVLDLPRIGGTRNATSADLQPYASTLASAGLRQQVFDFGRIAAESAAASLLVDVERARAASTTLDVTFGVTQAYYSVLAARGVLRAAQQAYERALGHRDFARAGVASGMRPPIEVTRAEADLTRYDVGRIRAGGSLRVARTLFAAAVGASDAELDAPDAPDAPTSLPAIDEVEREASTRDPRVLEARARLEAQRAQTKAAEAQALPSLFATASVSTRAGGAPPSNGVSPAGDGWVPSVANWNAGLVLAWPIFDATTHARARASKARETTLAAEVDVLRQGQLAAARGVYRDLEVAVTSLDALARAMDSARANHAQAEARFRAGLGTGTELSDAETLRTEAEIQLAIGTFQVARTRALLVRAMAESK